jgi:hypothetical protein
LGAQQAHGVLTEAELAQRGWVDRRQGIEAGMDLRRRATQRGIGITRTTTGSGPVTVILAIHQALNPDVVVPRLRPL